MEKIKVKHPILLGLMVLIVVTNLVLMFTTDIESAFGDYFAYRDFSRGLFMLCAGIGVLALDTGENRTSAIIAAIVMILVGVVEIWLGVKDVISIGYLDINLAPNLPTVPEGVAPGGDITPIVPGG